jgi:hypothetical protein
MLLLLSMRLPNALAELLGLTDNSERKADRKSLTWSDPVSGDEV